MVIWTANDQIRSNVKLASVLDQFFCVIFCLRPNSYILCKIRANSCRKFRNLCKLGTRPKSLLKTNSDLFWTHVFWIFPCVTDTLLTETDLVVVFPAEFQNFSDLFSLVFRYTSYVWSFKLDTSQLMNRGCTQQGNSCTKATKISPHSFRLTSKCAALSCFKQYEVEWRHSYGEIVYSVITPWSIHYTFQFQLVQKA